MLDAIDIAGRTITADALLTQRELARYLVEQRGANYHFTVKGNQGQLLDDIRTYFQGVSTAADHTQTGNGAHGRIETRKIWTTTRLNHYLDFPHVHQGGGWWTGLAILNVDPEEEEVTLLAHNQDGEVIGERDLVLGPGQKWVGTVEELFEEVGQVASITVMSQGV